MIRIRLYIKLQKLPSPPSPFTFSQLVQVISGSFVSNGWKGCFQWVERLLPLGGKVASNGWKQGFHWVERKC